MKKIGEVARIIRSKNAGPFLFTFDLMFDDSETYEKVKKSKVINKRLISELYNLPEDNISVIEFDPAAAIKITFPRPIPSGGLGDSDICGAQQHAPLYDIEIPF